MNQQDIAKGEGIARFLTEEGRIKALPKNKEKRREVLLYLAEKFEPARDYREREVNAVCEQWHTFGDLFLLRRELVEQGLLCRERNGSRYWRPQEPPLSTKEPR